MSSSGSEVPYSLSELDRRLANLLRLGRIEEVDYGAARVRVRIGDLLTGGLPWLTRRASQDTDWWAPEVGEQVLVLSPDGDPALGVVLGAVYQTAHGAVGDRATLHRTVYADGTVVEYDRAASQLQIACVGDVILSSGGEVTVTAATQVVVTAPLIQLN